MLEGLLHLFAMRSLREVGIDVLDLAVVTYIIYRALLVLRGTRAMQMGIGLAVIFVIYLVSKVSGFITLYNLLSSLLSQVILIVVVVFQND
ncbi:MAG: TIGR00159 family protein, partial [Polyangiaceae bacterium]